MSDPRKIDPPVYKMATKAEHLMGDISRKDADLCVIHSEDDKNYIGNWVEGYGFIDVRFPKETTRDLTEEEINHFNRGICCMGGMYWYLHVGKSTEPGLLAVEDLDAGLKVDVTTQNSLYEIVILDGKTGKARMRGGKILPTTGDFTDGILKNYYIGEKFGMIFLHENGQLITSAIKSFKIKES